MPRKQNLVLIFGFLIALIFIPGDASAANSTGTIEVAFILSEFKDQGYQEEHNQDYFGAITITIKRPSVVGICSILILSSNSSCTRFRTRNPKS